MIPSPTPTLTSTSASTTTPSPVLPAAKVTASPGFGATDLSPAVAIAIKVTHGKITKLTLTNPSGKVVKGAISKDGTAWNLGEVLGYGRTYTATGTAVGEDGKQVKISGTFTTVSADAEVSANITPGDDDVVGVAQPVIIRFPFSPSDKAEVEKHLTITTTPAVEGSWAWINHDEGPGVDWRPKEYWPAGTKVHVEANLYGLKLGDGAYGAEDLTVDFTIGRNQVVYADTQSHEMVVKRNGKVVATYPASYGSGDDIGDPNRVTRSGIHVVNEMLPVHKMSNPQYGYTNVTEYWDVRISNNGEFIHQNQGTVDAQGNTNVSHGCINLSAENAETYFKSALVGDPVEVTGSSVKLGPEDGDIFDWTIPWSQWRSLSAL